MFYQMYNNIISTQLPH